MMLVCRRAIGVQVEPQVNDVLRGTEEDGEIVNVRLIPFEHCRLSVVC